MLRNITTRETKTKDGELRTIQIVTLEGEVEWAKVYATNAAQKMNAPTGHKQAQINVECSKTDLKQLKELGMNTKKQLVLKDGQVYTNANGKTFIQLKTDLQNAAGEARQGPEVFDKNNNLTQDLIGNGSIAQVQFALVPYNHPQFGKGTSTRLLAIKVLNLVPYTAKTLVDYDTLNIPKKQQTKNKTHTRDPFEDD